MASLSRKANSKKNPVPRLALTIYEFCMATGISRTAYEKLKRQNRHPREMRIGKSVRISQAAAAQWIAAQEAVQRPEVAA